MKLSVLVISILLAACSGNPSKHPVYGKWQSRNQVPGAFFTFKSDGSLTVKTFDASGEVLSTESRKFTVVDEKTVSIVDKSQPAFKVRILARFRSGTVSIKCTSEKSADGSTISDYPEICGFGELEKIRE